MGKNRMNWSAAPWNDSELLECAMVVPETDDTATFTFRAPSGAWFDYQPGQTRITAPRRITKRAPYVSTSPVPRLST